MSEVVVQTCNTIVQREDHGAAYVGTNTYTNAAVLESLYLCLDHLISLTTLYESM